MRHLTRYAHPPLAPGHIDAPHRVAPLGDLTLETGETIRDFSQSYVTHGALNADRSNAILVCSALTGTHHRLDFLIGDGKALDTTRHFIVATDPIGNGLSSSPSNSVVQPGMRFPRYGVRDMVHAQHRLLTEHLGITQLRTVVGASLGGMQALQWATSHPGFMQSIVAMTAVAKTPPWGALVVEAARACLMADPAWTGSGFDGVPERGWRAYAGLINALVMHTPEAMAEQAPPGDVHAWFDAIVGQTRAQGFDATDYLYQSRAYQEHDVGATAGFGGDTVRALASITARALIIAPPVDLLNPVADAHAAAAAIPNARLVEIPSQQGHAAAASLKAADAAFLDRVIGDFLRDVA
jgi:homoserine O-acetyltransferase